MREEGSRPGNWNPREWGEGRCKLVKAKRASTKVRLSRRQSLDLRKERGVGRREGAMTIEGPLDMSELPGPPLAWGDYRRDLIRLDCL